MRRQLALGIGLVTLAGAAGLGGMAIAGGGTDREAERVVVAEPITATKAGPITRGKKRSPQIQTFYAQNPTVPPDGEGLVMGLKCPRKAGDAIGGGAATSEGIVVSYLSQLRPDTTETSSRVYWIGVDDNAGETGAGAFLEVNCAKRITVKK